MLAERLPKTHTYMIQEVQSIFKILRQNNKKIKLQWIPAHKGIDGNEVVDKLAKAGHNKLESTLTYIPKEDQILAIRIKLRNMWQEQWNPSNVTVPQIRETFLLKIKKEIKEWPWASNQSRTVETTMARLRLGHVGLAQHQFRFNLSESDKCPCGQVESIEHYLIHCPNHRYLRDRLVKKLMIVKVTPTISNLLGGGDFDKATQRKITTCVMKYIRETNKLGRL